MGYITIQSANPDISWVLGKNPDSGMICRTLRAGIVYGWYSNPNTYVLRFIDHTDEVSFKKNSYDQFNYLGSLQYCSPLLLSSIIVEMFGSNLNKSIPKDLDHDNKLTQHIIKLNNRALGFISKLNAYIKKFKINYISLGYNNLYRLEIISTGSIIDLLNYSYLLGNLLNVLVIGFIDKPSTDQLNKMVNFMIQINVPYYPRYLIKTNLMSKSEFDKLKDKLESFDDGKIKMEWGNSQIQRYNFIESNVNFSYDIIDFGCGEGFYVKKLLPKLSKDRKYFAWDIDPDELNKVKYFKEKNPEYTNLIIGENEQEFLKIISNSIKPTILLSEVFEHIEPNEAVELVNKIKSLINFDKIIITTPNVGFNKHYSPDYDETGEINLRHVDHKYEYTQKEFTDIVNKLFDNNQYQKNYYNVGDMIGENSITQSFIVSSNI
jgi:hypothetical protein